MKLYKWQKEAFEELSKHDFKGVVKVASGKGKTILALAVIDHILKEEGKKAIVVVPTIALLEQWKNEVRKFYSQYKVTSYYGEEKNLTGDIVISVINSAVEIREKFSIKILDEIHHYGAELYRGIFSLKTNHTIGLSATPEREDEGDFAIRYGAGRIVYSLDNLEELKERFHLCTIRVPFTIKEYEEYMELQKEYRQILFFSGMQTDEVTRKAKRGSKYALRILKLWSKQAYLRHTAENKVDVIEKVIELEKEHKIIIFSESIEFSETIGNSFGAIVVHSKLSKKEVIKRLDEFRKMKAGILVAPRMIDEGYDVPDADVAIVSSFTRSARQMIQRDGRLLRRDDYVRRYTLVLMDVEESKYYSIVQRTGLRDLTVQGSWLRWENGFVEDENHKKSFDEHEEHSTDYQNWIISKLDFFENTKQVDSNFYERHKAVIERLVEEQPERWKIFNKQEVKDKHKFDNKYSEDKKRELKNKLRNLNTKMFLPEELFLVLMRVIEGEEFELEEDTKKDIISIAKNKPEAWDGEIVELVVNLSKKL